MKKSNGHVSAQAHPMIDVNIITKIKVEKCGHMRKATFKAHFLEPNATYNPEVSFEGVAPTIQDILHRIERQFKTKLKREDFEFYYKLRRDETIGEWLVASNSKLEANNPTPHKNQPIKS
nr:hypothetical protein [uncultured Draconibacterium sp.]